MITVKLLRRRMVQRCAALLVAGAFDAAPATSQAQAPPAPVAGHAEAALPRKTFTKNTVFNLPIHMDEKTRTTLDQVCLYVKAGDSAWVRQQSAPPTLPHFNYRVPQDGEYWFTLVTIDKRGRSTPGDVAKEPPSLQVVVDTKPPALTVQAWTSPEGIPCIRCGAADANLNPGSVKATIKAEPSSRPLAPHPREAGVFMLDSNDLTGVALVTATDLAGNSATCETNLHELFPAPLQAAQATAAKQPDQQPDEPTSPANKDNTALPAIPPASLPEITEPLALTKPPLNPPAGRPALPALPALPATPATPPAMLPDLPQALPATTTVTASSSPTPKLNPAPEAPARAAPARPGSGAGSNVKQLINTTRAVVDYRVDQVGPSGIGKVDVYVTPDQGQTWQRLCEDKDRRSPVEFELPGEGTFGIRLAITNGNGFGGAAPKRGDAPTCVIEVDSTSPFVQLRPIEPLVTNGALEIRWQASDKNLDSESVSLFYRSGSDGPWQPIAKGIKNDGAYRWNFPRDKASQFFVKVEVADRSGNVARAESPNPVVLDVTEPQATVVNVSGVNRQ